MLSLVERLIPLGTYFTSVEAFMELRLVNSLLWMLTDALKEYCRIWDGKSGPGQWYTIHAQGGRDRFGGLRPS